MNHITSLTSFEDIYDAVQTGDILAKLGDTINGAYLMVSGFHLEPIQPGATYSRYTVLQHNTSTGHTFTEDYIDVADPVQQYAHVEILSFTKVAIDAGASPTALANNYGWQAFNTRQETAQVATADVCELLAAYPDDRLSLADAFLAGWEDAANAHFFRQRSHR